MISRIPFLYPFLRRPYLVVVPLILSCSAGILYLRNAERRFRSSAQLLVIQKDAGLSESRDAAFESSIDSEILGTHLQILSSPRVIRSAIERDQLTKLTSLVTQARRPNGLKGMLTRRSSATAPTDDDIGPAMKYIRRNLGVRRGGSDAARDAQVVEVTFQHYGSSEDCATILNSIVASYRVFLRDIAERLGEETKLAVTQASEKMHDVVIANEAKREQFLNDSPLIWHNGLTANPHQQQLGRLEAERSTLTIRHASLEARMEHVQAVLEDPEQSALELFAWIDQADIERLSRSLDVERGGLPVSLASEFGQLVKLKVELARKAAVYTADHSSVQQLQRAVDELQSYLTSHTEAMGSFGSEKGVSPSEIAEAYSQLLKQEMLDIESQILAANKLVQAEHEKAKELSSFEIEFDRVNRQLDRSSELYETLIERLRQLEMTQDVGGFLTEEITPVEDGYQVWPNAKFIVAVFGLLGICCGCGLALLAEFVDESFRDKIDIESALGLPLIAEVPLKKFTRSRKNMASAKVSSLESLHAAETDFSSAFRALRTAITFRTRQQHHPVLQVVSATSGEGRSLVLANLAITMARAGKRVLLVDGDLRTPSLHQLFGVTNDVGLTSITTGESLDAVAIPTAVNNLKIVPAGSLNVDGDDVFEHVFPEFIDQVRSEYDIVLVDSSPVSEAGVSLAVTSAVDFSLLVVSLSSHSRAAASFATRELLNHGANLLGIVVNGQLEQPGRYQPSLRLVREHVDVPTVPMEKVAS